MIDLTGERVDIIKKETPKPPANNSKEIKYVIVNSNANENKAPSYS